VSEHADRAPGPAGAQRRPPPGVRKGRRAQRTNDIVSGTGDTFEEAFDDLFPRAFRMARRMLGDSAAAEDVAAEAMARAYARWPKVSVLPYRDGWLLRVTANLAIDRMRRRPPQAWAQPPAEFEEEVALRMALNAALLTLAPRQRQAIALHYLGGLSDREVAEALGISLGSVKTHIHRGIAGLRVRLGVGLEEVVPLAVD
jgi:RNA polymerase sigma-70 factor (ECF subfamily)